MTVSVTPFNHDQLPGRVIFGSGRIDELATETDRLRARRVLLITGRSEPARTMRAHALLGQRWVGDYDELFPHVLTESADKASQHAVARGADILVSLGGGSATGLAKAVARRTHIPLLAVPTTFAGSEMTPFCGETTNGQKTVFRDQAVLARTVIYDPELTTTLPARLSGSSAINALAHAVEATYTAPNNPITMARALSAIDLLTRNLLEIVSSRNLPAREEAMLGAHLAGSVMAPAGMSIHHRVCHVLGGMYDFPHSYLNAAVLPHAVAAVGADDPNSLAPICRILKTENSAAALFDFIESAALSVSLAELGMRAEDIPQAAQACVAATRSDPRSLNIDTAEALLTAAFEGSAPPA